MLKNPEGSALSETIRLAHRGDSEAFSLIYRSYSELVHRICLRMLRDPAEAEDAAQDVFIRVFLKINTFRGESAFSSWLYRLATNVALMRLRKNKRSWTPPGERKLDTDSFSEIAAPDPQITDLFGRIDLQAAVDVLPDGYKQLSFFMMSTDTSIRKSPKSLDIQLETQGPNCTKRAGGCESCCTVCPEEAIWTQS